MKDSGLLKASEEGGEDHRTERVGRKGRGERERFVVLILMKADIIYLRVGVWSELCHLNESAHV